ncbi:MAG: FAD-binding oxidoreductase [Alphaproteobacteria bacterium]|nr:FAD-binding oxidoreductase [Alphaproteobacteria bacterium]
MTSIDTALGRLSTLLGSGGVLSGADVRARMSGWGSQKPCEAGAILRPRSTEEVSAILRICSELGQPVVPAGGTTGLVEGHIAHGDELLLSLELMNRIEEIDPANRFAVVEAGVPLQALQEAAGRHSLLYPLDLGARGTATIGGNISTNAGGNRVIRFGMTRDMVLGLEAVTADGSVISAMNRMIKNNAGYDLKQLFIGTEGTLGIVTRAVLRLREAPQSQVTGFVAVPSYRNVLTLLRRIDRGLGGMLSAFEVMWKSFYDLVTTEPAKNRPPIPADHPFYVLIEAMGGDQEADQARFEAVLGEALEDGLIADAVIAKSDAERAALWAMRDDVAQVARFWPIFTFDVSLPISLMEGYVAEVEAGLKAAWPNERHVIFGHLGDGNVHIVVGVGEAGAAPRERVERLVYDPLEARGGSVSAEHGIGLEKRAWLGHSRSEAELALMRTLKAAMDPKGILNPGKVLGPAGRPH